VPVLHAEIQVGGYRARLDTFTFRAHQSLDATGRPSSVVRIPPIEVTVTGPEAMLAFFEQWAIDSHLRRSGQIVGYDGEERTKWRLTFYDAWCVLHHTEFRSGLSGEAAYQVTLKLSPAAVDLNGVRIELHSDLWWEKNAATRSKALTKPPDPLPSPHLAAFLTAAKLKAEELGAGLVQKVITPAGELGTEILGVGLAALVRTASLTVGILLTPTNSRDDPGYASEWEMYRRNMHHGAPLTPDQLRLAQLERLHDQGDLRADEEAEMIALLASVKGIHVQRLTDLNPPNATPHQLLPGECRVGSFKALDRLRVKGDDITPHHIPSDAFMKKHGVSRNDGISIYMEQPATGGRHRQTRTYGGHMTPAQREAYYKMSPTEALKHDIDDARKIYRDQGLLTPKVEDALQQVVRQNKATFPHLFK
jgi:hypothetical protein